MTTIENESAKLAPAGDLAAIQRFKDGLIRGEHWFVAMLEGIKLWTSAEETYNRRTYRYLIDSEAFDLLLLAERMLLAVNGSIPEDEKNALLFYGKPPVNLPTEKFKDLIGTAKYHQYLNYFYGIAVEEALIWAVEEEIRKERTILEYKEANITNEAYRRIYGSTRAILLHHFREEKGYELAKSISLSELREFIYWLFKLRLKQSDKARLASDTKKALVWLNKQDYFRKYPRHDFKQEFVEVVPEEPG